jgi:CheY-like chemotaxis protein
MSLSDDGQSSTPALPEQELKERLESLGLVAGGIAHDFNNLLVGILGNAELLLCSVPADSPLLGPLRAIVTSAERAADHARELLDYAGRGPGLTTPLELGGLLTEVHHLAAPLGPGRVTVDVAAPDEAVWAEADRGQLTRMLVNLVKNALEATQGTGGRVELSLQTEHDGAASWAVLRVRDHGSGMNDRTRARIFDPFFSTKQTGHGLGLASAQSIVRRHRGTITVDSAEGQGSTFTVRLPRVAAPDPALLVRIDTPEPPRHGRVLVVDDDETVRDTALALLGELGFTAEAASSGTEALAALAAAAEPFDAVLLDATMAERPAAEALREVREVAPGVPILLCSGYSRSDFAHELDQGERLEFLAKPYRTHELARMLAKLLG